MEANPPRPDEEPTDAQRIHLLERILREIVKLAENNPRNAELQTARVLAKAGLGE